MAKAQSPLGLVVPVYDEIERVAEYAKLLVDFIADRDAGELVFVDDGSTDGTPDELDELIAGLPGVPARVLRRAHAGKGATVAAGLRTLETPLLGFCDLDLATPLDDVEQIAAVAGRRASPSGRATSRVRRWSRAKVRCGKRSGAPTTGCSKPP